MGTAILTINGGSSSVKFALFNTTASALSADSHGETRQLSGSIQRIGLPNSRLSLRDGHAKTLDERTLQIADHAQAANVVIESLQQHAAIDTIGAIGHRIVHGGPQYLEHAPITPEMLTELRRVSAIDPDHLPGELALIEGFSRKLPNVPQVACFDTAFHRDLPTIAKLLPIPRKYADLGVRRYGFHGLSFAYLLEELNRQSGPACGLSRIVFAHLGNGCSLAAVRNGKCIDTTMSFTPTAGLVMGTRSGDLDPGVLVYLQREQKMRADDVDRLVNHESGLLGISGISSDMRDLLAQREKHPSAAEAIDLFCYQARKWIGALAAALGGLETLVFSGGIGENAVEVRSQICSDLGHLGVRLDASRNTAAAPIISTDDSIATVRVIATDEEIMIAKITAQLLGR